MRDIPIAGCRRLAVYPCSSDEPQNAQVCTGGDGADWKGNYGVNCGAWKQGCQLPDSSNPVGANASGCAENWPGPSLECLVKTAFTQAASAKLPAAPFHVGFGAKLAQISDGTSKTLLMMEMVPTPADVAPCDRRARIWCEKAGGSNVSTRIGPRSRSPAIDEGNCSSNLVDGPCDDIGDNDSVSNTYGFTGSRSRHAGGVPVLIAGASAHLSRMTSSSRCGRG